MSQYQEASFKNKGWIANDRRRSMSFMICRKSDDTIYPGCQHDLFIPPNSLQMRWINKDTFDIAYDDFFHEKHNARLLQVQIAGQSIQRAREIGGVFVDGESILRSLLDLFLSAAGFYPDPQDKSKIKLRGSNPEFPSVYPDEIELRWFNWGFQIESFISCDHSYWKIIPMDDLFGVSWVANQQTPAYNINFLCYERLAVPGTLEDDIREFFEKNNILEDTLKRLRDNYIWSYADQLATKASLFQDSIMSGIDELRDEMERMRYIGGFNYETDTAKRLWEQFQKYSGEFI